MTSVVMPLGQWGEVGDLVEWKRGEIVIRKGWIREVVDPGMSYLVEWEEEDLSGVAARRAPPLP